MGQGFKDFAACKCRERTSEKERRNGK